MAEPFISGYALQWQQPATIAGAFEERFARGAFDKSLQDYPDVVALWSHSSDKPLGRVSNGTLTVKADAIGLYYTLVPNPDSPMGQEALATVGRKDLGQVSVGFYSIVEEWTDVGDLPSRLITEARLLEISLVVWGAYGDATSASLSRSATSAAVSRIAARQLAMEQKFRGIK